MVIALLVLLFVSTILPADFNTLLLLIFTGTIFRKNCQNTEPHKQTVSLRIGTTDFA